MKLIAATSAAVLGLLLVAGCGESATVADNATESTRPSSPSVSPSSGSLLATSYTNDFYRFAIGFNEDWKAFSGRFEPGCSVFVTSNMLVTGASQVGTPSSVLAHLRRGCSSLTIESVAARGGSPESALRDRTRAILMSNDFTEIANMPQVTVGGRDFYQLAGQLDARTVGTFKVRILCFVHEGEALFLTIVSENSAAERDLDAILGTAVFS